MSNAYSFILRTMYTWHRLRFYDDLLLNCICVCVCARTAFHFDRKRNINRFYIEEVNSDKDKNPSFPVMNNDDKQWQYCTSTYTGSSTFRFNIHNKSSPVFGSFFSFMNLEMTRSLVKKPLFSKLVKNALNFFWIFYKTNLNLDGPLVNLRQYIRSVSRVTPFEWMQMDNWSETHWLKSASEFMEFCNKSMLMVGPRGFCQTK